MMSGQADDGVAHMSAPPVCEGWLEKYGLGRSLFSRRGWCRRYFSLTHAGLAYSHSNPRLKHGAAQRLDVTRASSTTDGLCPLRPTQARCFIPFQHKRRYEVQLLPVYFLRDVSSLHHTAAPWTCTNGICHRLVSDDSARGERAARHAHAVGSKRLSCTSSKINCAGQDKYSTSSTRDTATTGVMPAPFDRPSKPAPPPEEEKMRYYYFGLCFEEGQRRYVLLLRTTVAADYVRWCTCLPLYVHEASTRTVVPMGHPLSVGHGAYVDETFRRLAKQRGTVAGVTAVAQVPNLTTFPDPDPCSVEDYARARVRCLRWNEGELERVVGAARAQLARVGGDDDAARALLRDELALSEAQYRGRLLRRADACLCGPILDESVDAEVGSGEEDAGVVAEGTEMLHTRTPLPRAVFVSRETCSPRTRYTPLAGAMVVSSA